MQEIPHANIEIKAEAGQARHYYVIPGTKKESVHIPVELSQSGLKDMVYNDFYVGEDVDVVIVAGCGTSYNDGGADSQHDGIHRFFLGKNARVKYIEKHYGEGTGTGERILNPVTEVTLDEAIYMEMGDRADQGCQLHQSAPREESWLQMPS